MGLSNDQITVFQFSVRKNIPLSAQLNFSGPKIFPQKCWYLSKLRIWQQVKDWGKMAPRQGKGRDAPSRVRARDAKFFKYVLVR